MESYKKPRTLEKIDRFEKATDFLNNKSRKSKQTKRSYGLGLEHFQTFLSKGKLKYDIESVLNAIEHKEVDVYKLLNGFVHYLQQRKDPNNSDSELSNSSILQYFAAAKSYLEFNDVDISSTKFKKKVTLPDINRITDEGIDEKDIRIMLQACTNERLKVFLSVLASSGVRAKEGLALRNSDVYFDESPTKVHIIDTKTKQH